MAKNNRTNESTPKRGQNSQSPAETRQTDQTDAPSTSNGSSDAPAASPVVRSLLSLLICGHLLAVALPPLAFQTGNSAIVGSLIAPLAPYAEFLYLDRGYAFFAPDPGPSHLIEAAVTQGSGERIETKYPSLDRQWPRLKYHRHFMLAEFLTEIYQPPGPPRELAAVDPLAAEQWVRLRARYEHVRQSMVDHLRHTHNDKPVEIRRIEHLIPSPQEYLQGEFSINDPRLYIVMLDRPIDDPMGLAGPPEAIPAPAAIGVLEEPAAGSNQKSPSGPSPDANDDPSTPDDATDESVGESGEGAVMESTKEQPNDRPAAAPSMSDTDDPGRAEAPDDSGGAPADRKDASEPDKNESSPGTAETKQEVDPTAGDTDDAGRLEARDDTKAKSSGEKANRDEVAVEAAE
ncbi:MAG: hypothetical protein HKN47_14810 [Pirellulaceae bacterium]|nr:hypothetical protein [Pirellulaceae bacterium]